MKIVNFLAVLLVSVGCASAPAAPLTTAVPCEVTEEVLGKIQYVTGADPCDSHAITIKGAPCTRVGIAAERRWLAEHFPGYTFVQQSLESTVVGSPCPSTSYDVITFRLSSGETRSVTFDITEFYGK